MNEKILITGASGYIGKLLISKYNYKDTIATSTKFSQNTIQCDFTNENEVKNLSKYINISKIINLASFVPKNNNDYFSQNNEINELITWNIVKYFKCSLIHISTLAVYENTSHKIINENTKIAYPLSNYGLSKYNSEQIIINNYKSPYIILRIPGIFGGDRKNGLIYNAIKANMNNKILNLNVSTKNWSTMYINDLLEILNQSKIIKINKDKIINVNYKYQMSASEVIKFISNYFLKKENLKKINRKTVIFDTKIFFRNYKFQNKNLENGIINYIESLR